MSEQPKSDRTSVTISKRVHREFKIACARLGVTQGSLLEQIIYDYLEKIGYPDYWVPEEED